MRYFGKYLVIQYQCQEQDGVIKKQMKVNSHDSGRS